MQGALKGEREDEGDPAALRGAGLKIGLVQSRFNAPLTGRLAEACKAELAVLGVAEADIRHVTVPGALEIAVAAIENDQQVVEVLNQLLEAELTGVVRYTHYSFLVFGFGRIPIVSWLRAQADESLLHAQQVGEWITALGAYPALGIGPLQDSHMHDIGAILRESLDTEARALGLYRDLLKLVEGRSVAMEEFARQMIHAEELHASEVDKMLRKPGELAVYANRVA